MSATQRQKISTTVAPETHKYLEHLVGSGRAASLAEAIDRVVSEARRIDSMNQLERDTAAYFEGLSRKAGDEESRLGAALSQLTTHVNFDE